MLNNYTTISVITSGVIEWYAPLDGTGPAARRQRNEYCSA